MYILVAEILWKIRRLIKTDKPTESSEPAKVSSIIDFVFPIFLIKRYNIDAPTKKLRIMRGM
jgi:hypothetical protein